MQGQRSKVGLSTLEPSTKLHHLSIRLRRDWYDALWRSARRQGQPLASFLRSLIVVACRDEHRQGPSFK